MSNRLKCEIQYPNIPGLDDSNFTGGSSIDVSRFNVISSELGDITGLSKTITVDSVFYSRSLIQNGGNVISRGCLYQLVIDELVNEDDLVGSSLNGGDTFLIIDNKTSRCWPFIIVASQRRNTDTYVVILDQNCDEQFSAFVDDPEKSYSAMYTRDLEVSREELFFHTNDIKFSVNYITNDRNNYVSTRPLAASDIESSSPYIWINGTREQFENGRFSEGNSILLKKIDGSTFPVELLISGDCSFINQTYDFTENLQINLTQLQRSSSVEVVLANPTGEYTVGKRVYVSATPLDLESDDLGSDYFIGLITSIGLNSFTLKTIYKPTGASRNSSSWYLVTEDPRINIPVQETVFLNDLQNEDLSGFLVENASCSFRMQITQNKNFSRYTVRYKPVFSNAWKYSDVSEGDTRIFSILPNSQYEIQVMGFGGSGSEFCSFSDSIMFNTFS